MEQIYKCKKVRFITTISILLTVTLLLLVANALAQDVPTISAPNVTISQPELPYEFNVSIYISNVENLTGVHFNLTFDPYIVIIKDVFVNQTFANLNWTNIDNTTGFASIAIVIEDPTTISEPVSIVNIRFEAINSGLSPLDFTFAEFSLADFNTTTPLVENGTIIITLLRPEKFLCAGFCHVEYVRLNNTDFVPNTFLDFNQSNVILGIFKDYNVSNLTSWIIPNPIIELFYNTSELYPPHKRGNGSFDAFKPDPDVEDNETGYLKWEFSNISDNEPYKIVKAFDDVQTGLLSDSTDMTVLRYSQSLITVNGTYWTNITVNVTDCFRTKIAVILENNSYMDANFTGYIANAPPGVNVRVKMDNKVLIAIFERYSHLWNPTNGTFTLNVSYDVVKFTNDLIEYKPHVKAMLRVRVSSDLLNNTFYMDTYNTSLSSVLFDRCANFSSSTQQNWTTEEFKVKVIHLERYFNVTKSLPDLVVIGKDEIVVEDGYQIYYIIKNVGYADAPAGHKTALIVDGNLIETKEVPVTLKPGDTYWDVFNTTIPYSSPPSDNITVCADWFDNVSEPNESNNCLTNVYAYPFLYNVSGTVYYEGEETGTIYVMAFDEMPSEESVPVSMTTILSPGQYVLKVPNGTYYIAAFMDVNGDKLYNEGEPAGFAINRSIHEKPDEIIVSGSDVYNVDITLKVVELYNITGTVYYDGEKTGDIYVLAFTQLPGPEVEPSYVTIIPSPGIYTLRVPNGTYYVGAFMDVNGNGMYDAGEPAGFAVNKSWSEKPDEIVVNGSDVYDVDITLMEQMILWEGHVSLIPGYFTITIDGRTYEIENTTALGALHYTGLEYEVSDEWYEEYGSLFVTSIANISSENGYGWMYWVNYPDEDKPLVGANRYEVEDGDVVYWYYGDWYATPENATYLIIIHVSVLPKELISIIGNATILWNRTYANLSSSPWLTLVSDFDKDSVSDIVFLMPDKIVAFRGYDGEILWERPMDDWFPHDRELIDLNNDGVKDIVICDGNNPRVLAINGYTGEDIWNVTVPELCCFYWACYPDLDGDGVRDVVTFGSSEEGYKVVAIASNGTILWEKDVDYWPSVIASKSFTGVKSIGESGIKEKSGIKGFILEGKHGFDFNGDGKDDVIVVYGNNISAIIGVNGSIKWKVEFYGEIFWIYPMDDINGDGIRDVLIDAENVTILSGSDGSELRKINESLVAPCIDWNKDGKCEFLTYDGYNVTMRMANGDKIWIYEFGSYDWVYVLGNLIVYGETYDYENDTMFIKLVKLIAENGSEVWVFEREETVTLYHEWEMWPVLAGDLNGDKVTDIAFINPWGVCHAMAIDGEHGNVLWEIDNVTVRLIGDFDGDNKGDVFYGVPELDGLCNTSVIARGDDLMPIFNISSYEGFDVISKSSYWFFKGGLTNDDLEIDLDDDGLGEVIIVFNPFTANSSIYVLTRAVARPDLIVKEIDVSKTVAIGQSVNISIVVCNIGSETSNATTLNLYIDENLVETFNVPELSPFECVEFVYQYTFETEGIHTIRAIVDPYNEVEEANEMNNESSVEIEVVKFKPDLTVEIAVNGTIYANQLTVIKMIVKNIGTAESVATTLDLYIDNDIIETFDIVGLNPSESEVIEYQYTFTAGQHVIKAVVDPDDLVDELDETNNESTITISVSPEPIIISFMPQSIRVSINAEEQLEITINKLPTGLSGYNITITVEDPSIAEIVAVEFPAWATLTDNSTMPASSVWIKAVDLEEQVQPNATNVILAMLTIRAKSIGNTSINILITKLDDDNGELIEAMIINGTINVVQLQPLPGLSRSPADPDGDGIFEDMNGNGRLDFDDVVKYFKYLEWMEQNYPTSLVDINGNGRIDFDDVVKLFKEV